MRLSLRTLLAFEDKIFDHEQHKQLEQAIPQHDAAVSTLHRIRSVMRNPRLGVPGLIDQREELDPNLVAEYLDHQMSEEIQERFEAYCLTSDKYLAEIAAIHTILSNVLGKEVNTSPECRQRCYNLYRQSPPLNSPQNSAPSFEERRPERNERETFISSSRQLFDDYLQSSPPAFRQPLTNGTPEFQQRPVGAPASDRPELIPFSLRQPEAENLSLFPSHHLTPPQFTVFPVAQPVASRREATYQEREATYPETTYQETPRQEPVRPMPVPEFQRPEVEDRPHSRFAEPWSTPAKKYRAVSTSAPAPSVANPSFIGSLWNWLTSINPSAESSKPEVQPEPKTLKSVRAGSWFLILLLCAAGMFGWSRFHKKESDSVANIPAEEVELTNSEKPNPVTVPVVKEPEPAKPEPPKPEPPKPVPPKPEPPKAVPQKPEPPKAPQVVADNFDPFQLSIEETKTEPKTATKIETKAEHPFAVAEAPKPAPPTAVPPVVVQPVVIQPAAENRQPEQTIVFAPNPMRSGESGTALSNTAKPPSTIPSTTPSNADRNQQLAARTAVERTFAKNNEVVRIESETPMITSSISKPKPLDSDRSRPLLVASPEPQPEPKVNRADEESIIAFQPISSSPKQKESDSAFEFSEPKRPVPPPEPKNPQPTDVWMTSVANQVSRDAERSQKFRSEIANEPSANFGNASLVAVPKTISTDSSPITPSLPVMPSVPLNPQNVITVGDIRETNHARGQHPVGRVLSAKEPCVVFAASTASDQWEMKRLPMELHADQYLLTTTPFRAELELEGGFRVEMVGDSKLCVLEPDENGVPGIFVDYGRLVIRPIAGNNAGAVRPLRIQTEKVQGIVRLIGSKSLVFVDTFAEILENTPGEAKEHQSLLPKTRSILGLLPDFDERISWQTDALDSPLVATRQAGIQLIPEKPELGNFQGLPNWLNRLPLPQDGEIFATVCRRIFDETGGNCEVALNRLIRESSIGIRSFGYRLWGDLGRFDIPLTLLSEAAPDDEPIRQMLVPYFRDVMKRDEETVQRLADAIEAVRR